MATSGTSEVRAPTEAGRNILLLTRALPQPADAAVGVAADHQLRMQRVRRHIAGLAARGGSPVAKADFGRLAAAGNLDPAGILLGSVDVVRNLFIRHHVIELRRRL